MTAKNATRVYLEATKRRTFAMALDWPGWGRSGKTAHEALAALAEYAPRYAVMAEKAKARFPASVSKGPRGGGRDDILDHVVGTEAMYSRKIGLKHRRPAPDDQAAVDAMREDIHKLLRADSAGAPVVPKGWPVRYAARRIIWHVLDHAWEMEDRRPGPQ